MSTPSRYDVIELRRYAIKPGRREHFARYFETYFPEAFQQLGAIVFGQGLEREQPNIFTWLRGFHDMNARAVVNAAFYYGPLWQEHKARMNGLMLDSDNVLLLRPLRPEHAIAAPPAVDPVVEGHGAKGIVVAQIFAVDRHRLEGFAERAEAAFERYRCEGVRPAGLLVSLDAPNNFPQLPVRTDGPFLVWLGLVEDDRVLEQRFHALATEVAQDLSSTGLLRKRPELVVMDPTARSRLRWAQTTDKQGHSAFTDPWSGVTRSPARRPAAV